MLQSKRIMTAVLVAGALTALAGCGQQAGTPQGSSGAGSGQGTARSGAVPTPGGGMTGQAPSGSSSTQGSTQ